MWAASGHSGRCAQWPAHCVLQGSKNEVVSRCMDAVVQLALTVRLHCCLPILWCRTPGNASY